MQKNYGFSVKQKGQRVGGVIETKSYQAGGWVSKKKTKKQFS